MVDEKIFAHAVTIAAAFVANGDIRCGGTTREDSTAMQMLTDLLPAVYRAVQQARDAVDSGVA